MSIETAICEGYVRAVSIMVWDVIYDRKQVMSDHRLRYYIGV